MSSEAKRPKIEIVGAGFSGLTLAYQFHRLGYQVEVVEKESTPGGMIQKRVQANLVADSAANAVMLTPIVAEMLQKLKVPYLTASKKSKNRFVYRGRPRRWPLGFFETLILILRTLPILIFHRVFFRPQKSETLEAWGLRCFGKPLTDYLLAPAINGIYAQSISILSADLVIGKFFRKNRKAGKAMGLISGKTCMHDLISDIQVALANAGVVFRFGKSWQASDSNSQVFICTRADDAATILQGLSSAAALQNAYLLRQIEYVRLTRMNCQFELPAPPKATGFGILFCRNQGIDALGVLQNSNIFDRTAPYNESWILAPSSDLTEPELLNSVVKDRSIAYRIHSKSPTHSLSVHWQRAIPSYSMKLAEIVAKLQPMQGIYLHGNYLGQLGLSGIAESSYTLAQVFHRKWQGLE